MKSTNNEFVGLRKCRFSQWGEKSWEISIGLNAKHLITLITIGLAFFAGVVSASIPEVKLNPNGAIELSGLTFRPFFFAPGWVEKNLDTNYKKLHQEGKSILAQTKFEEGSMKVYLTSETANSFNYQADVKFSKKAEVVMLKVLVPETYKISVPGKNTDFPSSPSTERILLWTRVKEFSIDFADQRSLEIEGNAIIKITDYREKKGPFFELRIYFTKEKANPVKSQLKLKFTLKSPAQTSLDLTQAVNRGFRDGKAGDGKGGWTDQGPGNDMRSMKDKQIRVGYVNF
ncbi:MAG: hypothetical protein JXR78_17705, partial [Victivallales bacterium]|nr:hypothetical protein [Victivallales bacterium]